MKKSKAPNYDLFKLIITILLFLLLFLTFRNPLELKRGISELEDRAENEVLQPTDFDDKEATLVLPVFPNTKVELRYDDESKSLVDSQNRPKFVMNKKEDGWIPVVPQDVLDKVGGNFMLEIDESNVWHIQGEEGQQFSLEIDSLTWNHVSFVEADVSGPEVESVALPCEGANPMRITSVGDSVRVVNNLIPLRSSPDATSANIVRALPIGTELKVVSLPICTPFLDGANQWWEVQTQDGQTGWVAEGSAVGSTYYLETID